ncbi:MAG: hypothetical protein CAK90_07345 [Spartobacteria bacterium AMD-G4]|jgi:hypothetical protein|nr:MAG: hypothetical protein CAK90_07345 [Spartobacteria bacterium AMD-G4]
MAASDDWRMIELEIYAAGVRQPEKMLGLALELDVIPNLCYKIDTNHDIVYMEFSRDVPSVTNLEALFLKLGLEALLVGQPPPKADSPQKTQRIY